MFYQLLLEDLCHHERINALLRGLGSAYLDLWCKYYMLCIYYASTYHCLYDMFYKLLHECHRVLSIGYHLSLVLMSLIEVRFDYKQNCCCMWLYTLVSFSAELFCSSSMESNNLFGISFTISLTWFAYTTSLFHILQVSDRSRGDRQVSFEAPWFFSCCCLA